MARRGLFTQLNASERPGADFDGFAATETLRYWINSTSHGPFDPASYSGGSGGSVVPAQCAQPGCEPVGTGLGGSGAVRAAFQRARCFRLHFMAETYNVGFGMPSLASAFTYFF